MSVVSRSRIVSPWRYTGCLVARCCSATGPHTPSTSTDLHPPSSALFSVDKFRAFKASVYRTNRSDPEFERVARKNELAIPLEAVKKEWEGPRGSGRNQLKTMGLHSNIYQDVYGAVFDPQGFIDVYYSDLHHVTWGKVMEARHTQDPPTVMLPPQLYPLSPWGQYAFKKNPKYPTVNYTTLVLTNPDGNILDSSQELVHWMVSDVPVRSDCSDVWRLPTEGHVTIPYLPPVPPSGTGIHRLVFTLYTHAKPLKTTPTLSDLPTEDWLRQRTFSTAHFMEENMAADKEFRPFTFSYFQTYWDTSVRHNFKNVLKYPEPVYDIEKKLSPRQIKKRQVHAVRQAKYTNL